MKPTRWEKRQKSEHVINKGKKKSYDMIDCHMLIFFKKKIKK